MIRLDLDRDSTINQLLVIYDVIIKNLDIGKDVRFIFCDISKAFDRVWHRGLLYKLRKYGLIFSRKGGHVPCKRNSY
jgi:hypothetical protein